MRDALIGQLREQGLSQREIADRVGVCQATVGKVLNPELRARCRQRNEDYTASLRGRCVLALNRSKANVTLEELEATFTGQCHSCGIQEEECTKRLALDHCHETGKFRGWLCKACNTALGLVKDRPELLVNYLRKT